MPLEGVCVCVYVCVTDVRNLTLKTLLSLFLNVLFPSSDLISFKKILLYFWLLCVFVAVNRGISDFKLLIVVASVVTEHGFCTHGLQ